MDAGLRGKLALTLAALGVAALLFELGCQLYALRVFGHFDALKRDPRHYVRLSENPILGYELAPGSYENHGRTLHINRHGIRDASDALYPDRRRVALLGDSVVFGASHTQDATISALLERELRRAGRDAAVLNFGVPGYALRELVELLRVKNALYRVHGVVYLLNPNDFARRESIYEGADNGLYRMYHRPWLKSPWFVRKAIYRLQKRGAASVNWYQWFFAGNEERGYAQLDALAHYARDQGVELRVVLLPAGVAYQNGEYRLREMYRRIGDFLTGRGIAHRIPIVEFGADLERYFDATDHLQEPGNALMARLMVELLLAAPS